MIFNYKQNIAEDSDKMEKFLALSLRKAVKTQMDFSDSVKKKKNEKKEKKRDSAFYRSQRIKIHNLFSHVLSL